MTMRRFSRFGGSVRLTVLFLSALLTGAASARAQEQSLAAPANSWTATATSGAPSGRFNHVAVWTGGKMIVWGGNPGMTGGGATLGTGGVYDPVSNAWSTVATAGAPEARESTTAVWTGTKMIIWGGFRFKLMASASVWDDGGIYDPATNSWTPVTTSGAPSARYVHTAVWTGTEMIVWGGYTAVFEFAVPGLAAFDLGPLNSGAIYNPLTNSWRPMSTVNAPSARGYHTAVWTGSRMIVWGGDNGRSTDIGGGGIYDPKTDTWTRTSTAGEPAGRDDHTAVWTGSRMIVWGGYTNTNETKTGGIFDPSANAWTATSTVGAPLARELHVAVWLRGRMIVWGGWTGQADTNTGGIYDPGTNTWTTTTTVGAPSGREQGTAVASSTAMIVWGGFDGSKDVSSGGIYTPPATPCSGPRECVIAIAAPDAVRVSGRS